MPEEPPPLTLDGLAAYISAWGGSVDPTEDAEAASAGWSALEAAEEWAELLGRSCGTDGVAFAPEESSHRGFAWATDVSTRHAPPKLFAAQFRRAQF